MSDFPKLTAGNVGPVTSDHMNRVFDSARIVLGSNKPSLDGSPKVSSGLWARLTDAATIGGQACWKWQSVLKRVGASVTEETALLGTDNWPEGNGYAIVFGESGTVGDTVLVYPLASEDGVAWFGATKGIPSGGNRVVLAPIVSATGSDPEFDYLVTIDDESVTAINQYEADPYGHGQSLSFANGELVPAAVEGSVICFFIDGVWYFDVPNPMVPECAT